MSPGESYKSRREETVVLRSLISLLGAGGGIEMVVITAARAKGHGSRAEHPSRKHIPCTYPGGLGLLEGGVWSFVFLASSQVILMSLV